MSAGDQVQASQVLARLEQTDLVYQIQLSRIDVELAELRARDARARGAPPLDVAIADKEVERAKVALERLKTERKSLEITAPYAGRIDELNAKPAAEVTAYQPIITIVGTEELVLVAEFSGPKSGRISTGQQVEVRGYFDDT